MKKFFKDNKFNFLENVLKSKNKEEDNTNNLLGDDTPTVLTVQTTRGGEFKSNPLPIIGHLSYEDQKKITFKATIVAGALSLLTLSGWYLQNTQITNHQKSSAVLQASIQKIGKASQRSLTGDEYSMQVLSESRNNFNSVLDTIDSYSNSELYYNRTITNWKSFDESVGEIIDNKNLLIENKNRLSILTRDTAELITLTEQFIGMMVQSNANKNNLTYANYALYLTQRMSKNVLTLSLQEDAPEELIYELNRDKETFKKLLVSFNEGNKKYGIDPILDKDAYNKYRDIDDFFIDYDKNITALVDTINKVSKVKSLSSAIFKQSDDIEKILISLENSYDSDKILSNLILLISLILGGFSMFLFLQISRIEQRKEAHEKKKAEFTNNRTQNAIMQLLEEMGSLSDGDLTKKATVNEEITGAIADSINMAIEDLSGLVSAVKNTANKMEKATTNANRISTMLLENNKQQVESIKETTNSVLNITTSISDIAQKTKESVEVAQYSREVSFKGMKSVEQSIEGMNTIKSNIEETYKRMERLTESSKQISEIVDLISDIAEQTTVLALNANIQASKAGEKGRGFKVVADSVKELAYKATDATKRIGALINATQTDIQAVFNSLKQTNEETNAGSKLSEQTSMAFANINEVSEKLANIVEEIQMKSNSQEKEAIRIVNNINNILEITEQSSENTQQTFQSINEVSELSKDLLNKVERFKV